MESWGWAGTIRDFMVADRDDVLADLAAHHRTLMLQNPAGSQIEAWLEEIELLKTSFTEIVATHDAASRWGLVLEYELPREGGRRPDCVLLAESNVVVMEFKSGADPVREYIDQVDAYARDLAEYHAATHGHPVVPVLVLVGSDRGISSHYAVYITGAHALPDLLAKVADSATASPSLALDTWLRSDYAPLPSLVQAARTIFRHEPLPRIRRAYSSGVEDAVGYLRTVAEEASDNGGLHLALVAGVPGAGKTLVGLRFVYETHFRGSESQDAVFLSGNGPLVKVLQHTLSKEGREGKVFVRDVHAFLKTYGGTSSKTPQEHMWVYDEAQRAWDVERVREKRPDGFSEPEDFLRLGLKHGDWALMVGLVGEGQEIHVGEEAGLAQWNDAMAQVDKPWVVHCPPRLASVFDAAKAVRSVATLDLDVPLRSHRAEQLNQWVCLLLDGELDAAAQVAGELKKASFAPLVTRTPEAAMSYVRVRYAEAPEARYGLIMSSQKKWAQQYGFVDDYYMNPGPWFADGEDSPHSCRHLLKAVTEFQCQGLELDMPVVGWGGDLLWKDGWLVPPGVRRRLKHPDVITKNVYRVLLTRGRDGFVAFVPSRPELDGVFSALVAAGCDPLELVAV